MDAVADALELLPIEQAVVEAEDELPAGPVERFEPERRGGERAVNTGRAVVQGGPPHAVVDADRRSDVGPGEPGKAAGLRRIDAGGHDGSFASSGPSNGVRLVECV